MEYTNNNSNSNGSDNGNGRVPVKIVQLLIENVKLEFLNSQSKIDIEIKELTKAIVELANNANIKSDELLEVISKLKNKTGRMVLVVLVVSSLLFGAIMLAVTGSHLLYRKNLDSFITDTDKDGDNVFQKRIEELIEKHIEENH